jgi:hypothetical protein
MTVTPDVGRDYRRWLVVAEAVVVIVDLIAIENQLGWPDSFNW